MVASVFGLALSAAAFTALGQPAPNAHWLLEYQGEILQKGGYTVNKLIWDKRFEPFFSRYLKAPQVFWSKQDSLFEVARLFLGVPGSAELEQGRYWDAYGCVPHDCVDTGLLWVDIGSPEPLVIFAALNPDRIQSNRDRLLLFPSENLQLENLPPQLRARVARFASTTTKLGHTLVSPLSTVTLVEPDGTNYAYDPAKLTASGKATGASTQP